MKRDARPWMRYVRGRWWQLPLASLLLAAAVLMPPVEFKRPVFRYVVTFDITQSMDVEDVAIGGKPVSRIDFAKAAMGDVLQGSDRPLLVTSGVALLTPGRLATEDDPHATSFPRVSEAAAETLAERGVRAAVVRLPPTTHGEGDHGFVPRLIEIAREKGVAAYIGDGQNRWPATHRFDAARVYRLALEQGATAKRYHAVAEQGVPFKAIADVIGRRLGVPVVSKSHAEAEAHFGWFARFAAIDVPTSSVKTRALLGWQPKEKGLIEDLDQPYYFRA